jgi:hypothetical protein
VCDLEISRIGAPYIYSVRLLRVNLPHGLIVEISSKLSIRLFIR